MANNEINTNEVCDILNEIMEYELAGVVRYTHSSMMVSGPYRLPIVTFLKEQAAESLMHAQLAGEKIAGLDGHPSQKIAKIKEIIKQLVVKELEEASTTYSAGISPGGPGHYFTPMAFSGGRKKDKKKKKKIARAAGMKPVNESQPFADFPKFPKLSRAQQESLDELFGFAESYQIFNSFNNNPKQFIKTLDDMAKIRRASNKQPKGVGFNKGKKQFVKEGRYHDWRNDESMTPKQKIGRSMREIRDALNELDKTVKMNLKLKTELKIKSEDYWKNTHKALTRISERLVKMANKVGNLK